MFKKKILAATFVVCMSVFLAGCQEDSTPKGPTNTNPSPSITNPTSLTSPSSNPNVTINPDDNAAIPTLDLSTQAGTDGPAKPPSPQITQDPAQPPMTPEQKVYYQAAKQNLDASYCKKIDNQAYAQQCDAEVADSIVAQSAIAAMDSAKCDGVKNPDLKEQCKAEVQVAITEKDKTNAQQGVYKSNDEILMDAQRSSDIAKCDQIKDEPEKQQTCKDRVNLSLAGQKNDKAYCDKIVDQNLKSQCTSGIK